MTFDEPFELVSPAVPAFEDIADDVKEVLSSKRLSNDGPFVRRLEARLAELTGSAHAVAVSSATVGLMLAIRAMGWRGEVILPSFTFAGTAHAVEWAGCTPVLAEVDPQTFTLDPSSASRLVGPETAGVIAVDMHGVPALSTLLLEELAGVPILVDGAHSLGTSAPAWPQPVIRVHSLHATKTVSAGEGGVVCTSRAELAARVSSLRNFGFDGRGLDSAAVGLNAKLPELSAVLALHQLERIPAVVGGRKSWDAAYRRELEGVSGIGFQRIPAGVEASFQFMPILIDERSFGRSAEGVGAELLRQNIVTRRYFDPPIHLMRAYAGRLRSDDLSTTETLSRSVLCLPLHPDKPPALATEIASEVARLARPPAEEAR